jgi:hypothetical protein
MSKDNIGKKMLAESKFYMGYSRWLPESGKYETWTDSVDRVMDMHREFYSEKLSDDLESEIQKAQSAYDSRLVLGAQRALQFGGQQLLSKHAKMYNCSVSYADRAAFFQETMYLLLCGCGVGFSVQSHHIEKIPMIASRHPTDAAVFIVPDSIEGWADAFGVLLSSYFVDGGTFPEYAGKKILFDFSQIRPKGAMISGGFRAPGPDGLRAALIKCEELIEDLLHNKGSSCKINPITAYDFVMHMSDAVLSGGVRRSATICLFDKEDTEMMQAKTGDWWTKNPQRGRSNNSVMLVRDELARDEWAEIMKSVKDFGEPGFIFTESKEFAYNPCFDPDTRIASEAGWMKIKDMAEGGQALSVLTDDRVGKDNQLSTGFGTRLRAATPAKLTRKQAKVFTVTTTHGHKITATANHIFPTSVGRKELQDLNMGDALYIPSGKGSFGKEGTYEAGLLLGLIAGDGTFDKKNAQAFVDLWETDFESLDYIGKLVADAAESISPKSNRWYSRLVWQDQTVQEGGHKKKRIGGTRLYSWMEEVMGAAPEAIKKNVPECVWRGSEEMVKGYIQGLIFSDGSVQVGGHEKAQTVSLRLSQSNDELLREVQTLLSSFGIMSGIYLRREAGERNMPDGHGGLAPYFCKANYELIINRPNCITFEQEIGVLGKKGQVLTQVLDQRGRDCQKPERFITKIASVEFQRETDVYCLTQEETNTVVANGVVVGQCVEIGMLPATSESESGFQFCNLTEINGGMCSDEETFYRACESAAILGTLQAGYTDFKYLTDATKKITEREALIGVSITGWMNNPEILFDEEILQKGAGIVKETNKRIAKLIGINQAARTTCAKPSGNASVLLGTASGIHGEHSPLYFRNVQMNDDDEVTKLIHSTNPKMIERSIWSAGGTDVVVSFPVVSHSQSIFKESLLGVRQLEFVKKAQQFWVETGTNVDLCVHPKLRHNISNTITVDDWMEVEEYIYENREWFAGISLLSEHGDRAYAQAPFTEVFTAEQLLENYGEASMFASGLIVDALHAFNNNLWIACSTSMGQGLTLSEDSADLLKRDWIRRAEKFAEQYFKGDIVRMTFCLKDCFNLHKWVGIQKNLKEVDFTSSLSAQKLIDADTLGSQGCAGGACEIF